MICHYCQEELVHNEPCWCERNATTYKTRAGDSRYAQDEWDSLALYAEAHCAERAPRPLLGGDFGQQLFNVLNERNRLLADIYRNLGR